MKKNCFLLVILLNTLVFTSCDSNSDEPIKLEDETVVAKLNGFRFLAKDNPEALISDIECTIIGDSIIECFIPHIVESKKLIPSFDVIDGKLTIDEVEIISNETELDCTRPLTIEIEGLNYESNYTLRVKSFTGLPIVYIDTENKTAIVSKDDYVKGTIRIVEDIETRGVGDVFESAMKIKGRGNTTWALPKKPYKIKFDEKTSLLGEPADKEWVLLANYTDNLKSADNFSSVRFSPCL